MQNNVYFNSGFSIIDGKLRHDNINVAPTVYWLMCDYCDYEKIVEIKDEEKNNENN